MKISQDRVISNKGSYLQQMVFRLEITKPPSNISVNIRGKGP